MWLDLQRTGGCEVAMKESDRRCPRSGGAMGSWEWVGIRGVTRLGGCREGRRFSWGVQTNSPSLKEGGLRAGAVRRRRESLAPPQPSSKTSQECQVVPQSA
ncbi:hypothetical protein E2C01_095804 [Portunus trituberculatus]|uniref:Uncharacterized protein n=1 Tax=Portunus trituberculatus TaxID=210409 RepID=A0A5B7K4Z5_PORTR|nr:hypothetical protein [Portunus trituberculatus]